MEQSSELGRDPVLAALVTRGNENLESLTTEEKARYNAFALREFIWWETLYTLHSQGSLSDDFLESRERYLLPLFSAPGRRVWWDDASSLLESDFTRYANRKLARQPIASLSEIPSYSRIFDPAATSSEPR
jgi:hypothetical protein